METEQPQDIENLKRQIMHQIADLSRWLGEIPSDDITVQQARTSFLKLSLLIGRALGIRMAP